MDGTSSLQSPAINGPTGWLSLYVVTSSLLPSFPSLFLSSELIRNSLIVVCLFVAVIAVVDRVADRTTDHKTNERTGDFGTLDTG